jgi:hypothetical protein
MSAPDNKRNYFLLTPLRRMTMTVLQLKTTTTTTTAPRLHLDRTNHFVERTPASETDTQAGKCATVRKIGPWRTSSEKVVKPFRSAAVCLAALAHTPSEAKRVPAHLWTKSFVDQAIAAAGDRAWNLLRYLPLELITAEICQHCVELNGYALGDVPDNLRTDELCITAIYENGSAIAFVPQHLRTMKNFRIAVASNAQGALSEIKQVEISAAEYRELSLLAVRCDGGALETLVEQAESTVDNEIATAAVLENPDAIRFVPLKRITEDLLVAAVTGKITYQQRQKTGAKSPVYFCTPLSYIAEQWPAKVTETLCFIAVSHLWHAIADVPMNFRTDRVLLAATRQTADAWDWIYQCEKTGIPAVAIEWVRRDHSRIGLIKQAEALAAVSEALGLKAG